MKISAKNKDQRERYGIYVGGVDVSEVAHEADDVAHVVTVVVLGRDGKAIRNAANQMLLAQVRGHVAIVSRSSAPAAPVQ